jgi:hypothetical protein
MTAQHTPGPRTVSVGVKTLRVWFTVDGPHRVELNAQLGYCRGWKRVPVAGPLARAAIAKATGSAA